MDRDPQTGLGTLPERVRRTVDAVYRSESRRVLATLIRLLGDFDLAEEALHDAFRAALEQWPRDGVPANPRAWLVSTGRFKAIDAMRRRARFDAVAGRYRRATRWRTPMMPAGVERREHRRRPAAADLHLLPSSAAAGRSSGADAARSLRPDDRGDCARLSLIAAPRWRSASCAPRQRFATRAFLIRCRRRRSAGPAGRRAAGDLPRVQRGILRVIGRVADAARSFGRGDPPRAAARASCCRSRKRWDCSR